MRQQDANRERLVQFLRDEDARKTKRFRWDFCETLEPNGCGSVGCALGAAVLLGIIEDVGDNLAEAIGLPPETDAIFESGFPYNCLMDEITATMVADKIEQVAAEGWAG